ncbi:MAG: V-type ATP synthase subunit A [Candidatus Hermodarchaeia archaeon]|jgi:V/A-type H+-transporting ATPase subunit A
MTTRIGTIQRIAGPLIEADGLRGVTMFEVCKVGSEELIGEVNRVVGDRAYVQVYEETSGLKPGEKVVATGTSLDVELGPGLVGSIFDGIQRPLPSIKDQVGDFITRGITAPPLPVDKQWSFKPSIEKGASVTGGDVLGTVQETSVFLHRILVPPGIQGKVTHIVNAGDYTIKDVIAQVQTPSDKQELTLTQRWPVRIGRPYASKIGTEVPLFTGQRVIDSFFPVAKGGTGAIPGGFGTGKTVTLHQLAKWADAEIIVYVGCGERGNEMTEVLEDFPKLKDPKSGKSLMERTLLVANTSNMPVAAREASIYTGITIAEYFRDQGYDVALMADSTSRWAEALREISGRLEEMPGEEGYPAYLGSRLAEFYERAGRVETLGTEPRVGSVTVTGAVSPAGGDFSEPVTQSTLRITKVFWALDKDMASRRFFPAINYLQSYSLYKDELASWYQGKMGDDWPELTEEALSILQRDKELREIVQLVGPDALPERERAILEAARMVKEDYLMQSALHPVDTYCPESKSYWMLKIIMEFWEQMQKAIDEGIPLRRIIALPVVGKIARMKVQPHDQPDSMAQYFQDLQTEINKEFTSIEAS